MVFNSIHSTWKFRILNAEILHNLLVALILDKSIPSNYCYGSYYSKSQEMVMIMDIIIAIMVTSPGKIVLRLDIQSRHNA